MKNLIFTSILLFLFSSCQDGINIDKKESQKSIQENTLTNPNTFIGKHKTKVMTLGVFHFSNPQLDSYKPRFPFDILEEKRQAELDILLEKIAAYKPTKILVEWNRIKMDSTTNARYQNHIDGSYSLEKKTNEVYQIGFKLAKKLGHDRLYCSDASADWFGAQLDWDNYDTEAYLKAKGQFKKSNRYDYESMYEYFDSLKTVQTLTENLIELNDTNNSLKGHQAYITNLALEGAGDHYLGADALAKWYRRNLRIYANTYDITDFDQEERLLLVYGAGHIWQLRQFFTDSPDFEYIEPNEYLKK